MSTYCNYKSTDNYTPSAREILAERCNMLDSTLDLIESMEVHGHTAGWDMADLISFAYREDTKTREQLAADRRYAATKRLIRILTKALATAVKNDELDAAECLADSISQHTYSLSAI